MANVYVRSGAAGAGTGADWANAYTTLAAAATAKAAGDTFWVSDDHAEAQGSNMTITFPGTHAAPNFVYSVNHSGTVPPVAADLTSPGTQPTIGTTTTFTLTVTGVAYIYNICFFSGSAASSSSSFFGSSAVYGLTLVNCLIKQGGSGAGSAAFNFGASSNNPMYVNFANTTVQFGGTGQQIKTFGPFNWRGGSITGSVPTTFISASASSCNVLMEGVDISPLTSATTFIGATTIGKVDVVLKDCKVNATPPTWLGAITGLSTSLTLSRTDSTGNYNVARYLYNGTQTTDISVYRSGGASDGTTHVGWKLVPTANTKWHVPFEVLPIVIWNDVITSTITLSIYGGYSVGVPNIDDIWFDVVCLDTSGNPLGGVHTTTKATPLTTTTAWASDTSTWNSSPGTKFVMSTTITAPAQKGAIYIYPKVGAAAGTFYIDPKVVQT